MKEKEKETNKVVEEPIVVEEKKENKIFATAKTIGKWVGIGLAAFGIGATTGYYFGRKSGSASTTVNETETTEI